MVGDEVAARWRERAMRKLVLGELICKSKKKEKAGEVGGGRAAGGWQAEAAAPLRALLFARRRHVDIADLLDEVVVDDAAVRAGDGVAVVGEEVEAARGRHDEVAAGVAAESLRAARHGGEDVVVVHGAEDEVRAGPLVRAALAAQRQAPALQAAHAQRVQVQPVPLPRSLHRHRRRAVRARRQEEAAVDQRVAVEDRQTARAQDALDPVRGRRENKSRRWRRQRE